MLLVLDEGDDAVLVGVMHVVAEECEAADPLDVALVDRWMMHRNDVSALQSLTRHGIVVDTIEIAARWSALAPMYDAVTAALRATEHTLAASAHQSHAYTDGACLYFTFAGRLPDEANTIDDKNRYYREVWDTATHTVSPGVVYPRWIPMHAAQLDG